MSSPTDQARRAVRAAMLSRALSWLAAAIGVGNLFGQFLQGALRNPSAADGQFGRLIFGFAVTEALGIFALLLIFQPFSLQLFAIGSVLVVIAGLVNLFLHSSALQFAVSVMGVIVFTGLTAYDTQKIKSMYYAVQGSDFFGRSVVMGALTLYLDFINLFLFLLRFLGDRR